MKWYGWGDPNKSFDLSNQPHLWPYIVKITGVEDNLPFRPTPPVQLESIQIPPSKENPPFLSVLREDQISNTHYDRVTHSYGKSLRDLWRIRNGQISRAPDYVCYPESEQDVVEIVKLASEHNVVLIPFGGGSNIAGCLEVMDSERMVVSLDMRRMNRVLQIDRKSLTATIEPGIMGPELERELNRSQVTLGHFPDSFEYSTLGGWVATRSAGMQSDKYGKIEDMVLSLRMVTPQGTIVTRTVPKSSNGIDVRHLCIGSEGILGIITEVTVQIHPIPAQKEYYAFLFPSFEKGVAAVYECARKGISPAITRLNDEVKTALSFAFKTKGHWLKELIGKAFKFYLKTVKRFDLEQSSLLIIALEGDVEAQYKQVAAIYKKHGAVALGTEPGKAFEKGKYDFPYIRDFVMDRGITADVSETSTVWSNLMPLYYQARKAIEEAIGRTGAIPWCSCHISHTYHSGASLYFTFACKQRKGDEMAQYQAIKKAAEDAFMHFGGTLSHHHAVGFEHLPWMESEVSEPGLIALKALKQGIDPQSILNPGKIIP